MNEDNAVTCHFGTAPRIKPVPARGAFGSLTAIAPGFANLPLAEQKAAINLMLEAGVSLPAMADGLGLTVPDVEGVQRGRCRLLPATADLENPSPKQRRRQPRPPGQSINQVALFEVSLDCFLGFLDQHRLANHANFDEAFPVTLAQLADDGGCSVECARRRLKGLEQRGWISRQIRSGAPTLVRICDGGRLRIAEIGTGEAAK